MKFVFKMITIAGLAAALVSCSDKTEKTAQNGDFKYLVDEFADLKIMRYLVPGWDELSLQQKKYVYHLAEAAKYGRDIIWMQNCKYNIEIRKVLENILENYKGDRSCAEFAAFETYAKRVFFSNGIHHHSPKMEIPNHILLGSARDAIKDGHTVTISVKGWSMRPFLEHLRDKVVLDNPQGAKIGDAVLAEISSGHFVLHRIIDIKHTQEDCQLDEITLMGDGNIHGTEQCLRKDICGIVTHYIRPNRTLSATDPKLIRNINNEIKTLDDLDTFICAMIANRQRMEQEDGNDD